MKKNLFLQGLIDKREGYMVEVRTEGQETSYRSYCYVISPDKQFTPVELAAYSSELDARAGHLDLLNQRERCLAYIQSVGLMKPTDLSRN